MFSLLCRSVCVLLFTCCVAVAEETPEAGRYTRPEQAPAFSEPKFISLPLTKAYPGAEFNMRAAVIGGTWPCQFTLITGPQDLKLDPQKGIVSWLAPQQEQSVEITLAATDRAGKRAEQTFKLEVSKNGFYFVSPDGADENPGSFEKPWKSLERAVQTVNDPAQATLYLRGGEYSVSKDAAAGKKNSNVLSINRDSPRHWMAWPGEKPVINLGWTEELWKSAIAAESKLVEEKKKEAVSTQGYGHRIMIDHEIDGLSFDGLEIKNAAYYMFVMWDGGRKNLSWRRCHFHHLYGDYYENSSFIFGFAADRKWEPTQPGEQFPFGKRPRMNPYLHMVVQDCVFSDRPYWTPREGAWHGGALVWYTTQGCLVEDNRFERIQNGMAILDKDCGLDNTYRNNIILGNVMFAAQGCNDGINFHHNFVDGDVHIGSQPGWLRNFWIHHNAIRGGFSFMAGATRGPGNLDSEDKKLEGPADPDSQAIIRDFPLEQRLIFGYANAVAVPAQKPKSEKPMLNRVDAKPNFAASHRFASWDHNLVDESAAIAVGWSGLRIKWSDMTHCGYDVHGARGVVLLDDEGHLPKDSAWRKDYGRDADFDPKGETGP